MTRDKELAMTGRKQAQSDRKQRALNSTALLEGRSSSNFANFALRISQKQSVSIQLELFSPATSEWDIKREILLVMLPGRLDI